MKFYTKIEVNDKKEALVKYEEISKISDRSYGDTYFYSNIYDSGVDAFYKIEQSDDSVVITPIDSRFKVMTFKNIQELIDWVYNKYENIEFVSIMGMAGMAQYLFTKETMGTFFDENTTLNKSDAMGLIAVASKSLETDVSVNGHKIEISDTSPFYKIKIDGRRTYTSDIVSLVKN